MLLEIIQDDRRTIIISSHILSDIEKVVDHLMILERGKLIRDCALDELREELMRVRFTSAAGSLPNAAQLPGVLSNTQDATEAVTVLQQQFTDEIERAAEEASCNVEMYPMSLEEIYRAIVGR